VYNLVSVCHQKVKFWQSLEHKKAAIVNEAPGADHNADAGK
jgi:hypothetical protein